MTTAASDVAQNCVPNSVANPGFETGNTTGWTSVLGVLSLGTDTPKEGTGYDVETWESKKGTGINHCLQLERLDGSLTLTPTSLPR
jgi:hypothetical protein